jgi:hypothetical protein
MGLSGSLSKVSLDNAGDNCTHILSITTDRHENSLVLQQRNKRVPHLFSTGSRQEDAWNTYHVYRGRERKRGAPTSPQKCMHVRIC